MEDIVKTLDMKFKLLTVINRDYEARLQRAKEREYTRRVKDISKILEEIYDLKIKAGYRTQGCSRRKPRGH